MKAMAASNTDGQRPGGYTFSAPPQPIHASRVKYRPSENDPQNIMFDKRVVRGNTHTTEFIKKPKESELENKMQASIKEANMRRFERHAKRRAQNSAQRKTGNVIEITPIPTYELLEELPKTLSGLPSSNWDQEQLELDREKLNVKYAKKPAGINQATSIDEKMLIDFDVTVEPLLIVLVGKSMEQGLIEVQQEEELKILTRYRQHMEIHQLVVYAEAQRMEAELIRKKVEKDKRIVQRERALTEQAFAEKKRGVQLTAKSLYEGAADTVLQKLNEAGYFYDTVDSQIKLSFLPWVAERTARRLQEYTKARENVDVLFKGAYDRSLRETEDEFARRIEEAKAFHELARQTAEAAALVIRQATEEEEARKKAEEEVLAAAEATEQAANKPIMDDEAPKEDEDDAEES